MSESLIVRAYEVAAPAERGTYRAVVRHASERVVDALAPRLEGSDLAVITVAAELVGASGSPRAVGLLTPLLRHPSPHVREAAAAGLAEIGRSRHLPSPDAGAQGRERGRPDGSRARDRGRGRPRGGHGAGAAVGG